MQRFLLTDVRFSHFGLTNMWTKIAVIAELLFPIFAIIAIQGLTGLPEAFE